MPSYCLCRRASAEAANWQAETSVLYSSETSSSAKKTNRQAKTSVRYPLETSSSTKETSYPSPATRSEAPILTKTWLVNCASAEDAPDHIGDGGSQVG